MGSIALLKTARDAGLTVRAEGGRLIIEGPKRLGALAGDVLARKADVLAALAAEAFTPDSAPAARDPDAEQKARESCLLLELRVIGFQTRRDGTVIQFRHRDEPTRRIPADALRRHAGEDAVTRIVTDADGCEWEELELRAHAA